MANITIDDKVYDLDTLPQEVKSQLAALQQCEQKINSWSMDIAMAQTARIAYSVELSFLLEQVDEVDSGKIKTEEVDEIEVLEAEKVEANR